MRQQHRIVLAMDQDVFGAAADALDALAFELVLQAWRQRRAQIGAIERDVAETPAREPRLQPADDGLDLR